MKTSKLINAEVSARLKRARIKAKLSRAEVAAWLTDQGYPASLKAWEDEKQKPLPQAHVVVALAAKYEVDVDELLFAEKSGRIHHTRKANDEAPKFLVLGTEWRSNHGGLSTLNRRFCRALASAGANVVIVALSASLEDTSDAYQSGGIRLIQVPHHLGHEPDLALLRPSDLPDGFRPDFIVGHGRITGPAARIVQQDFPDAHRLHFIHMAPDEIEWLKAGRDLSAGKRAEERTELEIELGKGDDVTVITVGPKLHERFLRDFHEAQSRVFELIPGFDNPHKEERQPPPGSPASILLFGRMEDEEIKGLDIGAAAAARAALARKPPSFPADIELTVRGVLPNDMDNVRCRLKELTESAINIVPRSYTADSGLLTSDLLRAKLVLMPSRSEGFGLVGLEAIISGTPVLVSGESGLGIMLLKILKESDAARMVVPVTGNLDKDSEEWSMAIRSALDDINTRFELAHKVRTMLARKFDWRTAIAELFRVLSINEQAAFAQGPKPI